MLARVLNQMAPRAPARKAAIIRERRQYEAAMALRREEAQKEAAAVVIQRVFRGFVVRRIVLPIRQDVRAAAKAWTLDTVFDVLLATQRRVEGEREAAAWRLAQSRRRARRRFARARATMVGPAKKLAATLHHLLANLQDDSAVHSRPASTRPSRSLSLASAAAAGAGSSVAEAGDADADTQAGSSKATSLHDDVGGTGVVVRTGMGSSDDDSDSSLSDSDDAGLEEATAITTNLRQAFLRVHQYKQQRGGQLESMAGLTDDTGFYFKDALNEGHFLSFARDCGLWAAASSIAELHSLFVKHSVVLKQEAQVVHTQRVFMCHAERTGMLPARRLLAVVEACGVEVPTDEALDFKTRVPSPMSWDTFYMWWDERRRQAEGRHAFAHDGLPPTKLQQVPFCGMTRDGFKAAMAELAAHAVPASATCPCRDCGCVYDDLDYALSGSTAVLAPLTAAALGNDGPLSPLLRRGLLPNAPSMPHSTFAVEELLATVIRSRIHRMTEAGRFGVESTMGALLVSRGVRTVLMEFQRALRSMFSHFTRLPGEDNDASAYAPSPPEVRTAPTDDDRGRPINFEQFSEFATAFYLTPSLIPNDVTDGFELLSVFLSSMQCDRAAGKHTCAPCSLHRSRQQPSVCTQCERPICRLSPTELTNIHNIFGKLDADKSGLLDEEELYRFARRTGSMLTDDSLRRFMALMDTSNDGLVSLSEFVTALEGSITMAKHVRDCKLSFPEFCLAIAAIAECGLTKPEFRGLLPPTATCDVRFRYFMSHLLAPRFQEVIGEVMVMEAPPVVLRDDPDLPRIMSEVSAMLTRIHHHYTHLGASVTLREVDDKPDGGGSAPAPSTAPTTALSPVSSLLSKRRLGGAAANFGTSTDDLLASLAGTSRPTTASGADMSMDVARPDESEPSAEPRDGDASQLRKAALATISPSQFEEAVLRLLKEEFLVSQLTTGVNQPSAYDDTIGLKSVITPRGLALRILLRRLQAIYTVYQPQARLGSRHTRQLLRVRLLPDQDTKPASPQAGGVSKKADDPADSEDEYATAPGAGFTSLWQPVDFTEPANPSASNTMSSLSTAGVLAPPDGQHTGAGASDAMARLSGLLHGARTGMLPPSPPRESFTDKESALAFMKNQSQQKRPPPASLWSTLRTTLVIPYRAHQPTAAVYRHSVIPDPHAGIVDTGAPPESDPVAAATDTVQASAKQAPAAALGTPSTPFTDATSGSDTPTPRHARSSLRKPWSRTLSGAGAGGVDAVPGVDRDTLRWSPIAKPHNASHHPTPPAVDPPVTGWRTRMKGIAVERLSPPSAHHATAAAPTDTASRKPTGRPSGVSAWPHGTRPDGLAAPMGTTAAAAASRSPPPRFPALRAATAAALPQLISPEAPATARGVGQGELKELLRAQNTAMRRLKADGGDGRRPLAPSPPLLSFVKGHMRGAATGLRHAALSAPLTARATPIRRPGRNVVPRDMATDGRARVVASRRMDALFRQIQAQADASAAVRRWRVGEDPLQDRAADGKGDRPRRRRSRKGKGKGKGKSKGTSGGRHGKGKATSVEVDALSVHSSDTPPLRTQPLVFGACVAEGVTQ